MPNIVGIGAVNVDYIIDSERGASTLAGTGPTLLAGIEPGSERAATAAEIDQTLQQLRPLDPVASPGGSSLNTLATIAATGTDTSVGFIGVRGRSGTDAFSLADWFHSLRIDDRHVVDDEGLAGICISYTDGGERSMLSTPGANRSIMEYLGQNSHALINYLKQVELILVTSFPNLEDITPLVEILSAVRTASPAVQICCDPGALWTKQPIPTGVDAVMNLSDWILVNQLEFNTYTGCDDGNDDHLGAATAALLQTNANTSLLLKRADRVETFRKLDKRVLQSAYPNSVVLRSNEIVDDTGAGDAFAAGFLISLTTPALTQSDGVELGFRLAREKLRWPGLGGLGRYREIYDGFVKDLEA